MTDIREDIFISYRRGIDSDAAARLGDTLRNALSKDIGVFRDIESKNETMGQDFVDVLTSKVRASAAVFVIIGRGWLEGIERLHDPDDVVRLEIELALQAEDTLVIPVLVGSAEMPAASDLPASIQDLRKRGGVRLADDGYQAGVMALIDVIAKRVSSPGKSTGDNRTAQLSPWPWKRIVAPVLAFVAVVLLLLYANDVFPTSSARIILMDSRLPDVVYDEVDRQTHNSNAKPIEEILDEFYEISIEPTSLDWSRDEQVMRLDPDLIIIHASAFYEHTQEAKANALLLSFIEAFARDDTKILIYSRAEIQPLMERLEPLFNENPAMRDRVATLRVPVENAGSVSFRNPLNARALKAKVKNLLD